MILGVLRQRQDFRSSEEDLFPTPVFGRRYTRGLHCLEETIMALFFIEQQHNENKWHFNKSLARNVCFKAKQGSYTRLQDEG